MEPLPNTRQEDKIKEMIENINKLKADVKDLKEAFDDIQKGQESINDLLVLIKNKVSE